jgi:hypothetical protein
MCSYKERKADPTEILQLDGFTVDYCEPADGDCRMTCFFSTVSFALCMQCYGKCSCLA